MRKSKFSDEKMVAILREADREPVAAVAKKHGQKNGERAVAPGAGWPRSQTRPVCPAGLHASRGWPLGPAVSLAAGGQGGAGAGANGGAVGAVSALRVPSHPDFSGPRRPSDERWPGTPVVAQSQAPGAAQTAQKAHRDGPSASQRTGRGEPRLVSCSSRALTASN
jgi:hypothetical protein